MRRACEVSRLVFLFFPSQRRGASCGAAAAEENRMGLGGQMPLQASGIDLTVHAKHLEEYIPFLACASVQRNSQPVVGVRVW